MGRHKKSQTLNNISFRADPTLLDFFHDYCSENSITRSEGLRDIFSNSIINIQKQKQDEKDKFQIPAN